MRFIIPYYNIEKLEKKAKKLAKKTSNFKFEIIEEIWIRFPNLPKENPSRLKAYEVEVEGKYQINGWEFSAVLEHKDNGNIIRNISNKELPIQYRTCKPVCEHCNKIRSRKDTFVLFNTDKNIYKQVGRQCLTDYTGMDLEEAGAIASFVKDVEALKEIEDDECLNDRVNHSAILNQVFKQYAYKVISINGYNKENIIGCILEEYNKHTINSDELYKEELNKITEWINSNTSNSEYMSNLKTLWNCEVIEFRDYRLIASGINVALKEIANLNINKNEYFGNVGDKIEIEVNSIRVLYTKYSQYYRGDDSLVYEIISKDGYTFICSTTKDLKGIKKLSSTIKQHKEYNGKKQTYITRPKEIEVVEKDDVKNENHKTCEETLDEFFKFLDSEECFTLISSSKPLG